MVDVALKDIEDAILGNEKKMESLLSDLRSNAYDEEHFYNFLLAIRKLTPALTKQHEILVGVILSTDWSSYSEACSNSFLEFITDLILSQAYYLKICIRSLIRTFLVKSEFSNEDLPKFQRKCNHVHTCINSIIAMAPLSIKFITDTVVHLFPYIGKSLFTLETYIVNILQLVSYAHGCRQQILALIVDKMLTIDVGIPKGELDRADKIELQFAVEDLNLNNSSNQKEVEKLDQLMTILLTYAKSFCFIDDKLQLQQAESLFNDLLQIYEGVVLKTQQSSHVQFILFYVSSFHKKLYQKFVEVCWKVVETPSNPQIIRITSSFFLASFMVRANYIDKEFLTEQISHLTQWIHRYLKLQDGNNVIPDYKKHANFYSVCQALFYVFVYHHQYFVETKKGMKFIKSLEFSRIVMSKLNPLKYCLKPIVAIFARITRMYEIVFCYSIIEHNNRSLTERFVVESTTSTEYEDYIECFFPFDPYVLTKSQAFIEPLYHHWQALEVETENLRNKESIDVDIDDIDEMFESFEDNLGFSRNSFRPKSKTSSFDMMCISPGFSLPHR